MRQLCPYCGKLVDLTDDKAGTETPCPACAKPFAVPMAYAPTVEVKPQPVPEPAATKPIPIPPAPDDVNDVRERCITISPGIVAWIPVLALTAALVSVLFFSWTGSFPGGFRAFTQSPLQALFATFTENTIPSLQETEKNIESNLRSNWWMLPFLLVLVLATILAWFERLFPKPTLSTVPAPLGWLISFWPRRFLVLFALSALAFALIHIQSWRGFGLETAIRDAVAQKFAKEMDEADTSHKKQEVQIKIGQEIGKYQLDDTFASCFGRLALVLALIGLLLDWWLDRRGDQSPPRIILRT